MARRIDDAELELTQARDAFVALDRRHASIALTEIVLAALLTQRGRLGEAESILARTSASLAEGAPTAAYQRALGALRSAQGRHDEAQVLLRDAVGYFAAQPRPVPHATTLAALGLAQLEAGQAREATATLEQALRLLGRCARRCRSSKQKRRRRWRGLCSPSHAPLTRWLQASVQ